MRNPQRALAKIVLAPGNAVAPDAWRGVEVRISPVQQRLPDQRHQLKQSVGHLVRTGAFVALGLDIDGQDVFTDPEPHLGQPRLDIGQLLARRAAQRTEIVIDPALQASGAHALKVVNKLGVGIGAALGHLGYRVGDAGSRDPRPVDVPLPARHIDAACIIMLDRLFAIHFCSPALDGPAHDLPPADRHPCTIGLPPFAYSMWFGTRHGIPLRHDSLGAHPVETSGLSSATQRRAQCQATLPSAVTHRLV